jgi:hypothetical protein
MSGETVQYLIIAAVTATAFGRLVYAIYQVRKHQRGES